MAAGFESQKVQILRLIADNLEGLSGGADVASVIAAIRAGSNITIDRSIPGQITIAGAGGMVGSFSPAALTTAAVTFDDKTWKAASVDAIASASWVVVVPQHAGFNRAYWVPVSLWNALPEVAVGDAATDANRSPLERVFIQGVQYVLGFGKGAADIPMIAWDGGHAAAVESNVTVYTI